MNLDHLRYFVVTSETEHTAKAAKILHVSQSTISHGIAKLEEEIGIELFDKVGKRIALTEKGKAFATEARILLAQAEKIKSKFRTKDFPIEGTFRIGATHGIAHTYLPAKLAKIQKLHPHLIFEIYSLRSAEVVGSIANKTLDAGVCFSPTVHPSIEEVCRKSFQLKIAVRAGHPLTKLKGSPLVKSISSFPCVAPKAFAGIEVCENHPELTRLSIPHNPKLIFDSYDVGNEYIKKSDAWCLMPDFYAIQNDLVCLHLPQMKAAAFASLIKPRGRLLPAIIETSLSALF